MARNVDGGLPVVPPTTDQQRQDATAYLRRKGLDELLPILGLHDDIQLCPTCQKVPQVARVGGLCQRYECRRARKAADEAIRAAGAAAVVDARRARGNDRTAAQAEADIRRSMINSDPSGRSMQAARARQRQVDEAKAAAAARRERRRNAP